MSDTDKLERRNEEMLSSKKILGQYKLFYIDYKENNRGRFVKITEKDGKFRNTIIVPEEAIADFGSVIAEIVERQRLENPDTEIDSAETE